MKKLKVMMMTLMMCLVSINLIGQSVSYDFKKLNKDSLENLNFKIYDFDGDSLTFEFLSTGMKCKDYKYIINQYNLLQFPLIYTNVYPGAPIKIQIKCNSEVPLIPSSKFDTIKLIVSEYNLDYLFEKNKIDTIISNNFVTYSTNTRYINTFELNINEFKNKDIYIYLLVEGANNSKINNLTIESVGISNSKLSDKIVTFNNQITDSNKIYSNNGVIYNLQSADKIFNLQGIDVTKLNGSLTLGSYIVKFNNGTLTKILVK